ncbi:MAG: gamma-glutamyltransferase, partial [Thermodesulfobacteriota bacterium]
MLTTNSFIRFNLILLVILISLTQISVAQKSSEEDPLYSGKARFHPVLAKNGMVASENSYATEAGLQVLKEG